MIMIMIITLLLCCIAISQVLAINPRVLQGCALLDTKLYCYGGYQSALGGRFVNATSDTYVTDLSKPLLQDPNTILHWSRVNASAATNSSALEPRAGMAITSLNKTHYIISGGQVDGNNTLNNSVILFDSKTFTSVALSTPPFTTYDGSLAATNSSTVWAYGGQLTNSSNPTPNSMLKLDLSTLPGKWSILAASSFAPTSSRYGHRVVARNTMIYYFGGFRMPDPSQDSNQSLAVSFKNVDFYNTATDQWGIIMTSGVTPQSRKYHTVTFIDDTSVLIYGGERVDQPQALPVLDYSYVISLDDHTYQQLDLNANGNFGAGPRSGHSAVLYDETILILFGYDSSGNLQNDSHILDVSNPYQINWVGLNVYDGDGSFSAGNDSSIRTKAIVGGVVGGVVLVVMIIGGLIYCRRKKNAQRTATRYQHCSLSPQNHSTEHVSVAPSPTIITTNNNQPPEYPSEPAPRYSLHAPNEITTIKSNVHKPQ